MNGHLLCRKIKKLRKRRHTNISPDSESRLAVDSLDSLDCNFPLTSRDMWESFATIACNAQGSSRPIRIERHENRDE